jgi:hypothetical protein
VPGQEFDEAERQLRAAVALDERLGDLSSARSNGSSAQVLVLPGQQIGEASQVVRQPDDDVRELLASLN